MERNRVLAVLMAVLMLPGPAGCGSEEDRVRLVPVSGKVTRAGRPVEGFTVSFVPDRGNRVNTPGNAVTDAKGDYKLRWRSRPGVAPGTYRVMIAPPLAAPDAPVPDQFKDDPLMARMGAGDGVPGVKGKKTRGPRTFGGEFDAQVGEGDEHRDFQLKEGARPGPGRPSRASASPSKS